MLFSHSSCPIIGAGKQGELFIRASNTGLKKLDLIVSEEKSADYVKAISTIDTIDVVTTSDRLFGIKPQVVLSNSPKINGGYSVKIQLFDLKQEHDQKLLLNDFYGVCENSKITINRKGYSEQSNFYEVLCKSVDDLNTLSKIIGVRSIKSMPILRSIRPQTINRISLPQTLQVPIDGANTYPIVAVVDSGVTDQLPQLNQWVIGRESKVALPYRNNWHGTFVAGLICWAQELNPDLTGIDSIPCSIFDLQVLPNDDPAFGDVDSTSETQLLQDLEEALKSHANEIKVWNFSLGSNEVCSLENFSSFAVELDRLQEKYNVSFVISAGNFQELPLLDYPRTQNQLPTGRITTPADSALGITVGSISHRSHQNNGPSKGEPSSFSRHGAGPNYIIKPDLVHFGGTCTTNRSETFGIRSIDGLGLGESIGTSFSTPLVSRLLANIYHHVTPTPSTTLARALLTHHARDPRTNGRVPDQEENYFGFGLPSILHDCLECNPWSSTLVFDDVLRPGYFLEWDNFPYPNSLIRNGKYFGDIWMTVAFSPSLNENWGSEYCETHIDAHFGIYKTQTSRKNGKQTEKFKGLVPPEHKNPGILYESYQVEKLRKWAPVRTYFGSLGENGVRGNRWRLMVQLLLRHGVERFIKPQRFALIVTISDPTKTARVYDEMAVSILNRFQAQNLSLRATTRLQARGSE